jgi:hypothetical protein
MSCPHEQQPKDQRIDLKNAADVILMNQRIIAENKQFVNIIGLYLLRYSKEIFTLFI